MSKAKEKYNYAIQMTQNQQKKKGTIPSTCSHKAATQTATYRNTQPPFHPPRAFHSRIRPSKYGYHQDWPRSKIRYSSAYQLASSASFLLLVVERRQGTYLRLIGLRSHHHFLSDSANYPVRSRRGGRHSRSSVGSKCHHCRDWTLRLCSGRLVDPKGRRRGREVVVRLCRSRVVRDCEVGMLAV